MKPKKPQKPLSGVREMIIYMAPRILTDEEIDNIADLALDPKWVRKRALTSSLAQDLLGVRYPHQRRPELERMLIKRRLPFRLFQWPNPHEQGELYFLRFTSDGEPPSQATVRRLLTPPKAEDTDGEGWALIPS